MHLPNLRNPVTTTATTTIFWVTYNSSPPPPPIAQAILAIPTRLPIDLSIGGSVCIILLHQFPSWTQNWDLCNAGSSFLAAANVLYARFCWEKKVAKTEQ